MKEAISALLSSASKLVFLMMAVGVHAALFTGKISGEQYMVLAGMAFTFYFANKNDNPKNLPYNGK